MARPGSPPPTPRVSFEGFSVRSLPSSPFGRESPEIHLHLSKKSYPASGIDPFSPLRMPEFVDVLLRDIKAEPLREASLDLRLSLSEGTHEFPLAGDQQFQVLVTEDAMAYLHLDAGPPPKPSGSTAKVARALYAALSNKQNEPVVVRRFELTFSPELKLPNLAPTLLEIQELMDDKSVGGMLRQSIMPSATRIRERLKLTPFQQTLQALAKSAGRLGHVALRHVHAEPVFRARSGRWELRIAFTGHVHLTGGIPPIPFTDVVVPASILPIPYATVHELLSTAPLATAALHSERVRVAEAVEASVALIERSTGRLSAEVRLPRLVTKSELVDGTSVSTKVDLPSDVTVSSAFTVQRHGERMMVDAEDAAVSWGTDGVHLRVEGFIEDAHDGKRAWLDRLNAHLEMKVKPGSQVPRANVEVKTAHPRATGTSTLQLALRDVVLDGGAGGLSVSRHAIELWPMNEHVSLRFKVHGSQRVDVSSAGLKSLARFEHGNASASVELGPDGLWHVDIDGGLDVAAKVEQQVPTLPELAIRGGNLVAELESHVSVRAGVDAEIAETNAFDVAVREGIVKVALAKADVRLDTRQVKLPAGTEMSAVVDQASLDSSGVHDIAVTLAWNLHGQECQLLAGGSSVSLLAPELRVGEVTAHVSSEGHLSFSGERGGLYGTRYFNTMLNPASDPEQLLALLSSEETLSHVFSALELLSPELADRVRTLRELALGVRHIAERLNILVPGDLIPRENMARFLSIALAGDESMVERLSDQIRQATDGKGLDVIEVKNILRTFLDEFDVDYEISGLVRWLDGLVSPLPFEAPPEPIRVDPVVESPDVQAVLATWPSASAIYEALERGTCSEAFAASVCRTAPRLRTEQLDYILSHATKDCAEPVLQWLGFVRGVKRRVDRIAEAHGGIEYAMQDLVIASFLGEARGPGTNAEDLTDDQWLASTEWPPACALGAAEVGVLMRAGLALNHQTRQAQINNRALLDLVKRRPGRFMREVLIEIGQNNPNAVPGVLFAFLEQDQDHMREPVDLPALLEEKLGVVVPRRREFMAGGIHAPDSYFSALASVAESVMEGADEVRAIKSHAQVMRHRVPSQHRTPRSAVDLAQRAQEAIARADEAARRCTFTPAGVRGPRRRAMAQYETAFAACRDLLAADRFAFQLSWLKRFWARNETALTVLSVVRNYQHDIDNVRVWLDYYAKRDGFDTEQQLVLAAIDVLYPEARVRTKLRRDPLIRLLIDPPEGHYAFTIISAMGVVTEGAKGAELSESFERLWQQRGVRVVRAPTGTAMSLEENAQRIVSSIERINGPFGLLGYSQGCANIFAAESLLVGGTPREQEMIQRLVSRNMLFSAFNGSPYGTFGSRKFLQQMVEAERFLKHYQVMFSSEVVSTFMRISKALLDSPLFVRSLGGVHSLTPDRAVIFHRDMQMVSHAPTSTVRAAATMDGIPESLEWMFNVLGVMAGGEQEDSQVLTRDEVGHSTRVLNRTTSLLARCEMPSHVQRSHHWSPLVQETKFVTTERDLLRHVYDSPKDRHVFPWIETNARFGLIRSR